MSVTVVDVDATGWQSALDFFAGILAALGAPDWHGTSIAALVDSMIYGGINKIEVPYRIEIHGLGQADREATEVLYMAMGVLSEHGAFGHLLGGGEARIEVLRSPDEARALVAARIALRRLTER